MRAPSSHPEKTIRTGKLAVNLDHRVVSVGGKPVHLTGKEYGTLDLLSLRKDAMLTKAMLLDHLYGGMDEPELKIIDSCVEGNITSRPCVGGAITSSATP